MDEKKNFGDRMTDFMQEWLPDIVVLVIFVLYTVKSYVGIKLSTGDVFTTLITALCLIGVTVIIKYIFSRKGVIAGRRNKEFLAVRQKWQESVEKIYPIIHNLELFCTDKNNQCYESLRADIMRKYNINEVEYKKICSADKLAKSEKKLVREIKGIKFQKLSKQKLTIEDTGLKAYVKGFNLAPTVSEFISQKSLVDFITTLLFGGIFAFFTFELVGNFNWGLFLWQIAQIVFFLIKGAMAFLRTYAFVTQDYTNRLLAVSGILGEFYSSSMLIKETEKNNSAIECTEGVENGSNG